MFTTIVIQPLYNALIFIVNLLPGYPLWLAMVILTILFKMLLIPLFKKQVRDQLIMQYLAPKLKDIQEKYKDKREILAKETLALYKEYKINPLMSILLLLVQLPFLIGLYQIFYYDVASHANLLYPSVVLPENISRLFLGVNLADKNYVFAVLAGLSQYVLGAYMFKTKKDSDKAQESDFAQAMNVQMKYLLPVMMVFISAITPSVVALYLIVTNLFGIIQEIIIKKPLEIQIKKELGE